MRKWHVEHALPTKFVRGRSSKRVGTLNSLRKLAAREDGPMPAMTDCTRPREILRVCRSSTKGAMV